MLDYFRVKHTSNLTDLDRAQMDSVGHHWGFTNVAYYVDFEKLLEKHDLSISYRFDFYDRIYPWTVNNLAADIEAISGYLFRDFHQLDIATEGWRKRKAQKQKARALNEVGNRLFSLSRFDIENMAEHVGSRDNSALLLSGTQHYFMYIIEKKDRKKRE